MHIFLPEGDQTTEAAAVSLSKLATKLDDRRLRFEEHRHELSAIGTAEAVKTKQLPLTIQIELGALVIRDLYRIPKLISPHFNPASFF